MRVRERKSAAGRYGIGLAARWHGAHLSIAVRDEAAPMSKRSKREQTQSEKDDLALDKELEGTFPASDPLKVTRSSGRSRIDRNARSDKGGKSSS
jgi:hypothetical protein